MSVLEMVGGTPLIELKKSRLTKPPEERGRVFAKAEFCNPSGSVKDRAALSMLKAGLASGSLGPGKIIIDATSGNTGIAYAMLGAALGFPVRLFLPANASPERKATLYAYGAEVIETSPLESSDGAFLAAKAEAETHPERYFYPNQYHNDANWQAHYRGTGPEIWEQTKGKITHFICGMGTSGTFMGTSRALKERSSSVQVIAVQPDSPFHGIEGTKHMGSTLHPGFYDPAWPDAFAEVDTDSAFERARRLAREEGLYVGISSGANVHAALRLAETLDPEAIIVTILCDTGGRYVSDPFWKDGSGQPAAGGAS